MRSSIATTGLTLALVACTPKGSGDDGPPPFNASEPSEPPEPEPEPPEPEPEPLGKGLARLATGLDSAQAACTVLNERECAAISEARCRCYLRWQDATAGWAIAALGAIDENVEVYHPIIRTSAGWALFHSLLSTKTTGMWGYYEDFGLDSSRVLDVDGAGEPELVFVVGMTHVDSDNEALPRDVYEAWQMVVICAREDAVARCTAPLLEKYEFDITRPHRAHRTYSATLTLGLSIVVSEVSNNADGSNWPKQILTLTAGSHSLADLLAPVSADSPGVAAPASVAK